MQIEGLDVTFSVRKDKNGDAIAYSPVIEGAYFADWFATIEEAITAAEKAIAYDA